MQVKNITSLMIIKPDGMPIFSDIVQLLQKHSIAINALKTVKISEKQAEAVYQQHRGRYYFPALIAYLTMAPCIVMAIEGNERDIALAKNTLREWAIRNAELKLNDALITEVSSLSLQDKVKLDMATYLTRFRSEFLKTFDGIHCSDVERGAQELAVFFEERETAGAAFTVATATGIIHDKLAMMNGTSTKGFIIDENGHQRDAFING